MQNYSKGILGSLQQTDHIINDSGEAVFGRIYGQSQDKKDGNYILITPSDQGLNICTDVVSSFTLWYYLDQHLFIASTSQRAIIKYIGSFELNENVIPWILSTGNLGPEISWDNRIKKAKPGSILQFNRHEWTIHESYTEPNYNEKEERSDEEWLSLLITGYDNIHQKVAKIYSDDWFLPLSGGYDSRGILTFLSRNLKQFDKLKTVTWGIDSAIHEHGTDASVARKVAGHYNLPHRYYLTEDTNLNPHTIFERFLLYGEGRIDQFAGYMDGFRLWKDLYDNGHQVSMRGDTFFKSSVPYSELSVLTLNKLELMSDYSNLKQLTEKYFFPDQRLPSHFKQKENESLNTWFYRLRHIHLHQCFVSALTQLKSGFTVQINPLMTYHGSITIVGECC